MVAIDACSRATCDSSAIVTLSRKRRCKRVLTVRRNQVPATEMPSAIAARRTRATSCPSTPWPSSLSQRASSASGNAAAIARTNAQNIRVGSLRYPNLHSRHIDDSAGGRSSTGAAPFGLVSDEDVIGHPFLVFVAEALRLQVEHGAVPTAQRHQLVV